MYAILYDDLYRLTVVAHPDSASESYDYDAVGNRTKNGTSTWQYSASGNHLTDDTTYTYEYDNNGNMTKKKKNADTTDITRYTYDAENQLTRIDFDKPPAAYVEYRYDGLGRRIEKSAEGGSASGGNVSTVTRYIYDNEDIIAQYQGTSTTPQITFLHGPGIDEPVSMTYSGQTYYYHTDSLGSISELTSATSLGGSADLFGGNSSGSVVQSYKYDSFGNILSQTGSLPDPYAYTGREFDSESGLYFYRFRQYDPRIGRFLQEDPIGLAGGNNFYGYTKNNPVNYTDPYGLYGTSDCSYYERQCEKYGGEYYCETARKACPAFNKDWLGPTEDPNPSRDDDYEGWQRCTRQCLQDCDQESKH